MVKNKKVMAERKYVRPAKETYIGVGKMLNRLICALGCEKVCLQRDDNDFYIKFFKFLSTLQKYYASSTQLLLITSLVRPNLFGINPVLLN